MSSILNQIYYVIENNEYFIFMVLVFFSVSGLIISIFLIVRSRLLKSNKGRFKKFLENKEKPKSEIYLTEKNGKPKGVLDKVAAGVLPKNLENQKEGRLKLIRAGYRSKNSYRNYILAKLFLGISLPSIFLFSSVFYVHSRESIIVALLLGIVGAYIPNFYMNMMISRRQKEISRALPDALDLMVVCTESGLGLDMTIKRVGEEIRDLSKALSDEFKLAIMEIRAGKSRPESFRNMFLRTDVAEVNNLMTILIQASRFGSSIGKSLRVHADAMRIKRRQIAEEKGAKVAVKLIFPLVLFIFPALMIVIAGPAFLQIFRILLPTLGGSGG